MSSSRIVLVEDDDDIRDRFATLLGAEPDFEIAGQFRDIRSARSWLLARSPRLQRPDARLTDAERTEARGLDVLLADLGLPDGNGIELVRLCARVQPRCEIAVVTLFADSDSVFACLEAGATGYILKDEMPAGIVASVRMLLAGGSPVSPSIARRLLSRLAPPRGMPPARTPVRSDRPAASAAASATATATSAGEGLSARETEILELVAKGLNVRESARCWTYRRTLSAPTSRTSTVSFRSIRGRKRSSRRAAWGCCAVERCAAARSRRVRPCASDGG